MKKIAGPVKKYRESLFPWIGSIILLPVIVYYTINGGKFTFIDYLNLLIHEGGHGVFMIFGKFLYFAGGTLMQIIIPGMFVVYYLMKRQRFGAQLFLVWLGENLLNISVYASDARARALPLLGGNKVFHDWNWLLRQTGLLDYDSLVGALFYLLAIAVFLTALILPLFLKEYENSGLNLSV
jgi:hypothetical protein